jgi:hypothetical protein
MMAMQELNSVFNSMLIANEPLGLDMRNLVQINEKHTSKLCMKYC